MRGNFVGLLAAALMAVCGVASANIAYNADAKDGFGTATWTITADAHSAADRVSSLAKDATPFCNELGCGLSVPGGPVFGGGRVIHESPPNLARANVPEPPTAILLAIGLACLGLARTRARARQFAAA